MDNRRKETRKKVVAFTPVRDSERGILLGYLGDLNMFGLMVVGEKPLEVNSHMHLSIDLPDDLPGISAKRMIVSTRIARCVQSEDSSREFDIGFAFTGLDPEQTRIIQVILERYHFRYES